MQSYKQDILTQPHSLSESVRSLNNASVEAMLKDMSSKTYSKVVFAGMGSSNYCSWGAAIRLSQHGVCNIRLSAGELLHYESGLLDDNTLLVLISQSGESIEICKLIDKIPASCTVAAITNDPNSSLAKRGDYTFTMGVEEEASVTTRTYLASLVIVDMISLSLVSCPSENYFESYFRRVSEVIKKMDTALQNHEEITSAMEQFLNSSPYVCLIGRGASLSTVEAGTLFLREVVKYPAFGMDSGEFRHGPMEIVDETFSGILIAPDGDTFELQLNLALDIAEKGGKAVFITTRNLSIDNERIKIILLPNVSESLSSLLTIIPIQLYAERLADSRGITPGVFRWGSKITKVE